MGQARIFGQTAAGGSGGGSTLTVIAEEGSSITVAKDDKVLTSTDNPAVFKKLEDGVWNATAEKEGKNPISQNIELKTNYTLELSGKIYGISRDYTNSSPHWTRTHDAVGMNATASVGTVPGESDFDNVYPWSEIHRETLSTGDVMVYIPKFYYRRYREEPAHIEHIEITDRALDGFRIHPLFDRPDGERDCAYVGAYETSNNNKSVSGANPQVSQTRATMRDSARAKGVGWSLYDISTVSAIQMLFLVEFATNDSQTAIGAGNVSGAAYLKAGLCDNVPNLTGKETTYGTVVYRGIENLWGNVYEFVDGVNWNSPSYYVCNDPGKYADDTADGYEKLSFSGSATWENAFIKRTGLDEGDNGHVILPSVAGSSGASYSTYFCDIANANTGWRVLMVSGNYSMLNQCGLFTTGLYFASSGTNAVVGSRLLYLP